MVMVKDQIIELSKLSTMDKFEIVSMIKKIVPEFLSNNSDFEQLDKSIIDEAYIKKYTS